MVGRLLGWWIGLVDHGQPPPTIRAAFTAAQRVNLFQAAQRILLFAPSYSPLQGDQMFSNPATPGQYYLGSKEVAQPFVQDVSDRLNNGAVTISSVNVRVYEQPKNTNQQNDVTSALLQGTYVICGPVTHIDLVSGGSGYRDTPTVTISQPNYPGISALAKAYVTNGVVSGFNLLQGGFAYTTVPTVALYSPTGTGAIAVASIGNSQVLFKLGNANAVVGSNYFVYLDLELSDGRTETVAVQDIYCPA